MTKMLGAIIGDIVGSRFEFEPTNDYHFELFSEDCSFTDDTIRSLLSALTPHPSPLTPLMALKHYIFLLSLLAQVILFTQKAEAQTERLPIIRLNGEFGYEYSEGFIEIENTDGTSTERLSVQVKWRGGSTNTADKHKRNYAIKFPGNHVFFNMRSDDKWILDAGQPDLFRLRNRVAMDLWNDFATKPYYSDMEPNAMSGVRGRVVEVYLNDRYIGIYNFSERLDRKQMKLKKFDSDGTIHGLLWKSVGYGCATMGSVPENYDNFSPVMDVFEAKYPELDDLDHTDYSILWNAINFVVNSSNDDFRNHVDEYFDLPVVIDYYLFVTVLGALDNTGKNMYWAVYDCQKDKKITPAIWDLDMTVGSYALEHIKTEFASPEYDLGYVIGLVSRLNQLNVDGFKEKVRKRYQELRSTFFSPTHLVNRYTTYYNMLKESGAAKREEERWSGDSDVYGMDISFDDEIQYINDWIIRRIDYLDRNYFNYQEPTDIQQMIAGDDTHLQDVFYNMAGQRIRQSDLPQHGIFIHNGKKFVR